MAFATVTSKGQTTIPKDVRATANLKAGDRIHFTVLEDGTIIVRVKNRSVRDIAIKPPGGKHVSIAPVDPTPTLAPDVSPAFHMRNPSRS